MRWMKWIGYAAAGLLLVACFMNWVVIPSRHITVSGVASAGTNFGKPGYLHILLVICFVILHSTPKIWAKRFNLAVAALNIAWAVRNYFIVSTCSGGECPEKESGIYLMLIASLLLLLAALFPDIKLADEKQKPD